MAYRGDLDALLAQCEALKRDLARSEIDALELERLRAELRDKTRQVDRLRAIVDPVVIARRRKIGLISATALLTIAGLLSFVMTRAPGSPNASGDSASWFTAARTHCNPLEARDFLTRSRPPSDRAASGYLAACWALGGHIDEARQVLARSGADRAAGIQRLFEIAHPIADRGDDRAAGPIMGLVIELWPENYMAWYHAGMSDYASGDATRAATRLTRFLSLYANADGWRKNAETALTGIAAHHSFAEAFSSGPDPRIE